MNGSAVSAELTGALLGAVLDGYQDIPHLTRLVSVGDIGTFGLHFKDVWVAICEAHEAGLIPDRLTVKDRLGSRGNQLPGGPAFLFDMHAIPIQAPYYAGRVRDAANKRRFGEVGARLVAMQDNPDKTSDDLRAILQHELDALDQNQSTTSVSVATAFERVIDTVQHGQQRSLTTPWPDLTELLGGWFPGQLIVVGGRPGSGKSAFLENVATDVARRGQRVLFVSYEMSPEEITQRTTAWTAKVNLTNIRLGGDRVSEVEMEAIARASQTVLDTPMNITENPYLTVDDIRGEAWAERQQATRDGSQLGMVVVDYAQLMPTPNVKGQSRQQALGEVTRALKRLARELAVPVVVGAQLGREAEARTPLKSDLRESGDLENDADVILLLNPEKVDDAGRSMKTGAVDVIVAKSRNGPEGVRTLAFHGHYSRFAQQGGSVVDFRRTA